MTTAVTRCRRRRRQRRRQYLYPTTAATLCLLLLSKAAYLVHGFAAREPPAGNSNNNIGNDDENTKSTNEKQPALHDPPFLPTSKTQLIRQASQSMLEARRRGFHRQVIKLPLSESMYADKEEGFVADRAIGWQGGPQETIQYLTPLVQEILQQVSQQLTTDPTGGLPARVQEQVLLDFDGSSLVSSQHPLSALHDIQALLQANTDDYYWRTLQTLERDFSDSPGKPARMLVLVNPAWRDASSFGWLAQKRAQEQILDRYELAFAMDQFVVKGTKLSLLYQYSSSSERTTTTTTTTTTSTTASDNDDNDDANESTPVQPKWWVYFESMPYETKQSNEDGDSNQNVIFLGSFAERPSYQQLERLLIEYQTQ